MAEPLVLDGSRGEGGGQILRTALAASAITGTPVLIQGVRGRRRDPGLRPQHLAVVRALATICAANVRGNELGATKVLFGPTTSPQGGEYRFDLARIAADEGMGGSAGSVTLLLQALLLPLSFADRPSTVRLIGGTHVRWSPPYHYLAEVYAPLVERLGYRLRLELGRWGWYPQGGGALVAEIEPVAQASLSPLTLVERGKLEEVWGISAASKLPEHIVLRQREQAQRRLRARHIRPEIDALMPTALSPGTVLFLLAQYTEVAAGFTGYGRIRYPAERVADDAADALEAHLTSKQALDPHLADQILLPLALVPGEATFTTSEVTSHLRTVAWVIESVLQREVVVEGSVGGPGSVTVR